MCVFCNAGHENINQRCLNKTMHNLLVSFSAELAGIMADIGIEYIFQQYGFEAGKDLLTTLLATSTPAIACAALATLILVVLSKLDSDKITPALAGVLMGSATGILTKLYGDALQLPKVFTQTWLGSVFTATASNIAYFSAAGLQNSWKTIKHYCGCTPTTDSDYVSLSP